jgi:uncharacterized protein
MTSEVEEDQDEAGEVQAGGGEARGAEAPDGEEVPRHSYDRHMLEVLVCPQTHARLHFDVERQELISRAAHLAYPIRDGIPVMLVDEARQID